VQSLAPASSAANADEDLRKMQDDNSDDLAPPAKTLARAVVAETKTAHLRLLRQEWLLQQACFKEGYVQCCYPSSSFVQRSWDGDAESGVFFDALHASIALSVYVMFL
jgi:hypothetical protein